MNYQARRNLRTLLCPFVRPMTDLDINTYTYTNSKKKPATSGPRNHSWFATQCWRERGGKMLIILREHPVAGMLIIPFNRYMKDFINCLYFTYGNV